MNNDVNSILEECKDKFKGILVVGIHENGALDIRTNLGDFFQMQGVLKEAGNELFLYKKNEQFKQESQKVETVEVPNV